MLGNLLDGAALPSLEISGDFGSSTLGRNLAGHSVIESTLRSCQFLQEELVYGIQL